MKPKAKNAEWDEFNWYGEDDERYDHQWESEEYEASKEKKGKGKGSKPKGKSKGKNAPRSITPRPSQSSSCRNKNQKHKNFLTNLPYAKKHLTNFLHTKSSPISEEALFPH